MPRQEFPPLLPAGLHPKTWGELEALCIARFPLSKTRGPVMAGLKKIVAVIRGEKLIGDLWVDGSLLTEAIDPQDADVVFHIDEQFQAQANRRQRDTLKWLTARDAAQRAQMKRDYLCDTYTFWEIPPGHPEYPGFSLRLYWLSQFGSGRSGNPKGIAVLTLSGDVQ